MQAWQYLVSRASPLPQNGKWSGGRGLAHETSVVGGAVIILSYIFYLVTLVDEHLSIVVTYCMTLFDF